MILSCNLQIRKCYDSYDLVIAKLVIWISNFQVLMFNSIKKDPVLHSSILVFVSISRMRMISLFVHMQQPLLAFLPLLGLK